MAKKHFPDVNIGPAGLLCYKGYSFDIGPAGLLGYKGYSFMIGAAGLLGWN